MSLEIRKATLNDAERICYISEHTKEVIYPKYYPAEVTEYYKSRQTPDKLKADIEAGNVIALIFNGSIIGLGSRTENIITRVYVLPEAEGQGFGSMIMQSLETAIFAEYDHCELNASAPAALFYENRGFYTTRHIRYELENGSYMIYEIMRKDKKE